MNLSPFELVLSKLPEARPVGGTSQRAWRARCPAHADDQPSLCVSEGEEGRALIYCHAGCPPEAVVAALGLSMADLMPLREREKVRRQEQKVRRLEGEKVGEMAVRDESPGDNQSGRPSELLNFSPSSREGKVGEMAVCDESPGDNQAVRPSELLNFSPSSREEKVGEMAVCDESPGENQADAQRPSGPGRPSELLNFSPSSSSPDDYESAEQAIDAITRRLGPCSRTWVYHDDCEDPIGYILRWDTEHGKEIRPVSRHGGHWVLGGMPAPRPLYRLVELLKRCDERVYVTEGEKAADAAISLGLLATTSPHGSSSARKADWRPLAGRDVVLLPDNDDAGRRYADDVTEILLALTPPAIVRVIALPELEPKGDIYDWLEHHDAVESKDLRTRLEHLVDAEPVCSVLARASLVRDSCPVARGSGHRSRDTDHEKITPDGVTTNHEQRATAHESRLCQPILTCMADVEETQIRWLWPGRMSLGRITMLVGRPGEGKSFLTTDMAARVTRGATWPDGSECPEGSVLLISAEDDPRDTVRPRLRAHGADLSRVHLLTTRRRTDADGRESESLFTLADVEALETVLQAHRDCKLVVVDPIGSFLGGRTDAHRDNDVRSVLVPVARLAEQYDASILVVAHRRKSPGGFADDMALGSRAFTGLARAVWHVSRDRDDKQRRLLLPGKNNLAAEGRGLAFTIASDDGAARIRWESDPIDMTADEALREESAPASDQKHTAVDDAMDWLQDTLADGPLPTREILQRARAEGIAKRTLSRAKEDLGIRSHRPAGQEQGGWCWSLPRTDYERQVQECQECQECQSAV